MEADGRILGSVSHPHPPCGTQGVLVLLDSSQELAVAMQARLHAAHLLDSAHMPPFSKGLVAQASFEMYGIGVLEARAGLS